MFVDRCSRVAQSNHRQLGAAQGSLVSAIRANTAAIVALAPDLADIKTSSEKLMELELTREKRGNYGHLVA